MYDRKHISAVTYTTESSIIGAFISFISYPPYRTKLNSQNPDLQNSRLPVTSEQKRTLHFVKFKKVVVDCDVTAHHHYCYVTHTKHVRSMAKVYVFFHCWRIIFAAWNLWRDGMWFSSKPRVTLRTKTRKFSNCWESIFWSFKDNVIRLQSWWTTPFCMFFG